MTFGPPCGPNNLGETVKDILVQQFDAVFASLRLFFFFNIFCEEFFHIPICTIFDLIEE